MACRFLKVSTSGDYECLGRRRTQGLRIDGAGIDQRVPEHLLVVGEGQLDRGDRVALVAGR